MKRQMTMAVALAACGGALGTAYVQAQGRGGVEWTTSGGDAQRTAAIRTDPRISLATMQKPGEFGPFKFLWKLKLEYEPNAPAALTQPILLDRLIGFRGFKSIAFLATASETVHAIDVDFGTPLWKYHINYSASPPPVKNLSNECPGGLSAALSRPTAIAPSAIAAGGGGGGRGGRSGGGVGEPGKGSLTLATAGQGRGGPNAGAPNAAGRGAVPGSAAAAAGNTPGGLPAGARAGGPGGGGGGAGGPFTPGADAAYVVGSDGYLHALNVQNGWDNMTPTLFLPANTRAAGLIIATNADGNAVAYAATTRGCGSQPDGVWALDLSSADKTVTSFQAKGATIAGASGAALGRDGTVYVATRDGQSPMANSVIALEAKTLKVKGTSTVAGADFDSTPLVFQSKDKDMILAAGNGKLVLFDSASLSDGPVATSPAFGTAQFDTGALASWQDAQGVRWVAAASPRGIVTMKIVDEGEKVAFATGWTSRDIPSPITPLAVNGVLFAASSGTRALPSVLYALDAATGKELWSSGKAMTSIVRGGLSAGGGNVYVPATDGTLYAFGFAIEK